MKILKWLLISILVIVAAALIFAAFLPSHVTITAETLVKKPAVQAFHFVASFNSRAQWDPWITADSTAIVNIETKDRYTGSFYTWDGKKIKTGKIRIDSVSYGESIHSSIYFGDNPESSSIAWKFEENPEGTHISWTFDSDSKFPIERLFMAYGKGMMQTSLNQGLANLKKMLEERDTHLSSLSPVNKINKPGFNAVVAEASGTIQDIMPQFEKLFIQAYNAITEKGLTINGPAFGYYYNYDQENQNLSVQCGFPVQEKVKSVNNAIARSFPEMEALSAIHTGPYEEFEISYGKMMKYAEESGLPITWDAFEFYLTDPDSETMNVYLQTELCFPLKK